MKIANLIFAGFFFILILFSITTYVNYRQFEKVKEDNAWLFRSQMIIRSLSRLQRNILDMESGLRGYLLTAEPIFLSPYDSAARENEIMFYELDSMIALTSEKNDELQKIRLLHQSWLTEFAEPLIEAKTNAEQSDSSYQLFRNLYYDKLAKTTEAHIRSEIKRNFREFSEQEYQLREQRKTKLEASVASTSIISFTLTSMSLLVGGAIAFYIARVISGRINHMVSLAENIAGGNYQVQIEDKEKDELSNLSRSLNNMASILQENISELERKNNELDRFAYVVSHDLKAPLRGIENVTSWIEEDYGDVLPEKVTEYLKLMQGRIYRMENLIDGILRISRIGRGKKVIEEVDTKILLEEIIEMIAPSSAFSVSLPGEMPVFCTDKVSLQQVFINLMSNAIKYHDKVEGNITITWKDLADYYEFTIKDDGPGIEAQYHEKIFVIFQTLQERDTVESTGVGLAIVKKILEDKKGSIRVESKRGKGAAFIFQWPKDERELAF